VHRFGRRLVGRNIVLSDSHCSARRSVGYDGGLIISAESLTTDELLQASSYLSPSVCPSV